MAEPHERNADRCTSMRIVSWNCNGGFQRKANTILAFEPDVLIVQECSQQDAETTPATNGYWVGSNPHRGLAAFVFGRHSATLDGSHTADLPWFLPLAINNLELNLLAVWASVQSSRLRYVRVMHEALNHHAAFLESNNAMVVGDFNSNAIWDGSKTKETHGALVERLDQFTLASAYHLQTQEPHGEETVPTFYLYRHRTKPYHIDYAFVPEHLSPSCRIQIGNPEKWLALSDHMPLILDVDFRPESA